MKDEHRAEPLFFPKGVKACYLSGINMWQYTSPGVLPAGELTKPQCSEFLSRLHYASMIHCPYYWFQSPAPLVKLIMYNSKLPVYMTLLVFLRVASLSKFYLVWPVSTLNYTVKFKMTQGSRQIKMLLEGLAINSQKLRAKSRPLSG